jgi:8-oxo-dGTP diphosphatase
LTDGDSVLLVRHTYGHRDWDLPGGAVRRGEAPHATATREMREELGVSIDGWTDLGQLRGRIDFRRDHMHLFHSELDGQPITMDRCELAAVRWFRRGELPPDLGRFVVQILSALGDG